MRAGEGEGSLGCSSEAPRLLCAQCISAAFDILGLKKPDQQSVQSNHSKQPSLYLKPEWRRERAGPELNSGTRRPDQRREIRQGWKRL